MRLKQGGDWKGYRRLFAGANAREKIIATLPTEEVVVFESETERDGKVVYYGQGFAGRREKPDWNYRFRSLQEREDYISEWAARHQKRRQEFEEARERKKSWKNPLKVGDTLYGSWGYEQTNVEFFEVVEVKGKRVVIRELATTSESSDGWTGRATPIKGEYVSEPMLRVAQTQSGGPDDVYVNLHSSCCLGLWDGRAKSWSSYG